MEGIVFFVAGGILIALGMWVGVVLRLVHKVVRNPMEWGTTDRALLLVGLYLFLGGAIGLAGGVRYTFQVGYVPWVNFGFWRDWFPVLAVLGFVWLGLMVAGLVLHRKKIEHQAYAHLVGQATALAMAFLCYALGPMSDPRGFLSGMAQGLVNLLLLGPAVALPWVATYALAVFAAMGGVWLGVLPYAPFFAAMPMAAAPRSDLNWISSYALLIMVFLLLFFLMAFVVARWRDRELRLAEMTAVLKKMFGQYLSTEVMHSLIENPSALELGGEKRQVTIMMTDLRGFTALSEQLDPEQVVSMLNSYFEVMVDVVLFYKGTINEIIGDALLVIFGAPQEMQDRAERAIACAIAMQNAMIKVNAENRAQGLPDLEMGIGLNEAEVIVGNIGSTKRSKYTVVGSGVNMASRIESYTVGGQILISDTVRRKAGDKVRIDNRLQVLPKGAEQPVTLWDIGGIGDPFNLILERPEAPVQILARPVPLRFTVLEGKHVGQEAREAKLIRLSRRSADLQIKEPLALRTNLRLNLVTAYEDLARRDFYGKVIDCQGEGPATCRVSFSALPSIIDAYFQAALDQGA